MITLREAVKACTDAQLRRIYLLWGMSKQARDASVPAHSAINNFLERVNDPIAARFVWTALTDEQHRVLFYLLTPGVRNGLAMTTLQQRLPLGAALPAVLQALDELCLVYERPSTSSKKGNVLAPYGEVVTALYRTGQELMAETGAPLLELNAVIGRLTESDLRRIARNLAIQYANQQSIYQLRSTIERTLLDGDFPALQQLSAEQRKTLKTLCKSVHPLDLKTFCEQAGVNEADSDAVYRLLHSFTDHALAFDTFYEGRRVVFVPEEIKDALLNALSRAGQPYPQAGLHILAEPPRQQAQGLPLTLFDLAIVVNAVYQQTIQPTQAGTLPKRITNKLRPLTSGQSRFSGYRDEDNYLTILFSTATTLGLIHCPPPPLSDMKPTYELANQLEQWSQMTLVEQGRLLVRYWSEFPHNGWLDIVGELFARDYNFLDYFTWSPFHLRKTLVTYLQRCMPEQWYSIPSLLETIWQEAPYPQPVYGRPKTRVTEREREKWMRQQGEVYIGMLASSLFEFGIVDLGYSYETPEEMEEHHYHPDAFMLNEFGSQVLLATKSAEQLLTEQNDHGAETKRTLIVQPNFELLILEPDMPTLYSVLPFAQVEQVKQVSRLTLTRNSLLRGMSNGLDLETILAILNRHSQKELPQNVDYTLHDWARAYKGARISTPVLIEVSSEAIADELVGSTALKSLGLRRLGPRALVTSKDINTVRNALDKIGVAVSFGGSTTAQKSYGPAEVFTFDTSL
jgi:hypothetical protein